MFILIVLLLQQTNSPTESIIFHFIFPVQNKSDGSDRRVKLCASLTSNGGFHPFSNQTMKQKNVN